MSLERGAVAPTFALGRLIGRAIEIADSIGQWMPGIALRMLLAWEFGESGLEKLRGQNWFSDIQDSFPFPFSMIPTDISWHMATWGELAGAAFLVVGLGTRFWASSLLIIDLVAWAAVHAGNGYNVCDNGFKLPLIYVVLLLPLILKGPGRASLDRFIAKRFS